MRFVLVVLLMLPVLTAGQDKWQKFDQQGKPVPIKQGPWYCAKDNETGLTWEVKSWHENPHYYKATRFDSATKQGVKDGGSCQQGDEWYPCDVSDYLEYVNKTAYCGIANWRLPTLRELKTLVYRKNIAGKLQINPYIFGHTTRSRYLSGDVSRTDGRLYVAMLDFLSAKAELRPVDVVANVRLVSD